MVSAVSTTRDEEESMLTSLSSTEAAVACISTHTRTPHTRHTPRSAASNRQQTATQTRHKQAANGNTDKSAMQGQRMDFAPPLPPPKPPAPCLPLTCTRTHAHAQPTASYRMRNKQQRIKQQAAPQTMKVKQARTEGGSPGGWE